MAPIGISTVRINMRVQSYLTNALILILVAALAYLPLINQIGYSHDDWYLMASARAEGPGVFHKIYSVDRPLRAYILIPAYRFFGQNALLYNLSAWFFRVLSALCILWLLRMLWPASSQWTLLMALLYVIYPGFLSQLNGIDYQAQMVSLAAATFSLGLTVYVFFEKHLARKVLAIVLAVLTGILYLGLVEYEVGFELIRLLLLFILTSRIVHHNRERFLATIKLWLPYFLIIFGFGIWRVFFFESERGATDVNLQFEGLRLYPLQTIYHWSIQIAQDLLDVTFSAWVVPLAQLTSFIRPLGILLSIISAGCILFVFLKRKEDASHQVPAQVGVYHEALWLGFFAAVGGLIPIAMVNREVSFPVFSRYGLVSSVGVAVFLTAILMRLKNNILRNSLIAGLCVVSILTQHANTTKQARETSATNMFWWQVAWRVPQFEKDTTLIANYPAVIEEDYFVWGPASLIYYPEKQNPKNIQPGLFASVLNAETITKIQARERQEYDNRKHIITYKNYRNFVLLNQPSINSCVHVIDGNSPEHTHSDSESIQVIGPYSEIEHVLADETPHTPPVIVFGPEPARGWCYYYQKADLARQQGNWNKVLEIGQQAFDQGLFPIDLIEWMPFLQAYTQTGNVNRLKELAPIISADPFIAQQVCGTISPMPGLSADMIEAVNSLYCLK